MSMPNTILKLWRDIRSLVFPECCMVCGGHITPSMNGICPRCRLDIPLTNYWLTDNNPSKECFDGLVPVYRGSSFFFYKGNSLWRTMIHRFKYGGMRQIAYNLGVWYGAELKASTLYDDVDIIIPLPLHPIKSIMRGYNQSRYLAEGIAKMLGATVDSSAIRRTRNNPSQARLKRGERWESVDNLFRVTKPERLRGKHILIVDDVLTTGATLYNCMLAIHTALPDARISFATLAVTQRISHI